MFRLGLELPENSIDQVTHKQLKVRGNNFDCSSDNLVLVEYNTISRFPKAIFGLLVK